jgi:hypothetical protein
MYELTYFEDLTLFYVKLSGKTTRKLIVEYIDEIYRHRQTSPHIKIISDFRYAQSTGLSMDDLMHLANYASSILPKRYKTIQWANISASPVQTAGTVIFAQSLKSPEISYNIVTSAEGALRSLDINLNEVKNHQLDHFLHIY